MSELQLVRAGFYLITIAVVALVLLLLLSLIMLIVKNRSTSGDLDVGGQDAYAENNYIDKNYIDKNDEYGIDFERRILENTLNMGYEEPPGAASSARRILTKDVRELTIPKQRMIAVKKGMELKNVLIHMMNNDVSSCPVYYRSIDDILGVVSLKTLLKQYLSAESDDAATEWESCIESPPFVHSTISINSALDQMLKKQSRLAIVLDENAKTMGIITREDIILGILKDSRGQGGNVF